MSLLRDLISNHVAPGRVYLEARWSSLAPYAAAAGLLADVLPIVSGANRTAYGFLPNAGTVACSADPACASNGAATGLEDQYILPEGIYLTGRANIFFAQALASELNAFVAVPEPTTHINGSATGGRYLGLRCSSDLARSVASSTTAG